MDCDNTNSDPLAGDIPASDWKTPADVQEYFPAFDPAARFFYGVENPKVEFYDGDTPLDIFMEQQNALPEVISIGERNSILSKYHRM